MINTLNILMHSLTMILVHIMLSKFECTLYEALYTFHLNLMYPFSLKHIIKNFYKRYCK